MISEYRGAKTKQVSSLLLDDFKEREDAYYANILMDTNTPIVSDPIINGERMRSRSLSVLLKLDPAITDLSLLYYVSVVPQDSPRNP